MYQDKTTSPALSTLNVGEIERMASVTLGSALLVNALVTGRRLNWVKGIAGALLLFRGATGYCPVYGVLSRNSTKDGLSNVNIRTSVLVDKNRQDVYNFWRRLENLPFLMKHLDYVRQTDERISDWKLKVPGNLVDISWKAEIVKDEPGLLIGWQSIEGSPLRTAGKVEFTDEGNGQTGIDVTITYHPPLGAAGNTVSRLFTPAFRKLVQNDIRNFKEVIEGLEKF